MRRRSMDFIGTFEEKLYTGELSHLYQFRDLSFGDFPIGVRTKRDFIDQIELGQLCHVKVEVKGHKKPREDGSCSLRVILDAFSLENLRALPEEEY